MLIALLLTGLVASAQTIPCKGKTKAGLPCKSKFVSKESGYCHAHDPNKTELTEQQKRAKKLAKCIQKSNYSSCDSCITIYKSIN